MDRSTLPFRKNCEGYFFNAQGSIIAKKTSFGIAFPGGGVEAGEFADIALVRETFEETGAIVNQLKQVGQVEFVWASDWAHTQKQKQRYQEFNGEDMTFFTGTISGISMPGVLEEDFWGEDIFLTVSEVLKLLKEKYAETRREYTLKQIEFIESLSK